MRIAIMAFLYSTAARIGEVVRLNRKDIDWGNKEVIIYGEKGKKERTEMPPVKSVSPRLSVKTNKYGNTCP